MYSGGKKRVQVPAPNGYERDYIQKANSQREREAEQRARERIIEEARKQEMRDWRNANKKSERSFRGF